LSLVSRLLSEGKTVDDHLADFADRFGAYASGQISIRVDDLTEIDTMMATLRGALPEKIGEYAVAKVDDFRLGFDQYPPSDILRIHLANGARVIVRPSGTEPKLKVYLDASSLSGTAAERQSAAAAVISGLDSGMHALLGHP
jgi:phosphomannomutase